MTASPDKEARPAPTLPEPRAEARRRAAAYLDLWERQLSIMAVEGDVSRVAWLPPT